jgi:hypothetical protein
MQSFPCLVQPGEAASIHSVSLACNTNEYHAATRGHVEYEVWDRRPYWISTLSNQGGGRSGARPAQTPRHYTVALARIILISFSLKNNTLSSAALRL